MRLGAWRFNSMFRVESSKRALGALLMAFDFVLKLRPLLPRRGAADEVRQ
jgi:hypothetical protein